MLDIKIVSTSAVIDCVALIKVSCPVDAGLMCAVVYLNSATIKFCNRDLTFDPPYPTVQKGITMNSSIPLVLFSSFPMLFNENMRILWSMKQYPLCNARMVLSDHLSIAAYKMASSIDLSDAFSAMLAIMTVDSVAHRNFNVLLLS
ncbi:ABC transporter ATP-binding, putative [Babesia ovis]|uniref:ABC transporter ATP-binding, putative n=1 Tax=Babesia ovis TaxID=5869 RepID=A0A9W5TCT5_BABOV|nr:ABC transporter ATP-binding, putative [Babesia ovis]